ncbi:hypothetical protein GCM10020254_65610 [Streptomyces goshikiensis]
MSVTICGAPLQSRGYVSARASGGGGPGVLGGVRGGARGGPGGFPGSGGGAGGGLEEARGGYDGGHGGCGGEPVDGAGVVVRQGFQRRRELGGGAVRHAGCLLCEG